MAQAVNSGSKFEIKNYALTDSADTPVSGLTGTEYRINNILIRARESGKEIAIRASDGATDYFTVPEGVAVTIDIQARNNTPIYLRCVSGSCNAEVIITYE